MGAATTQMGAATRLARAGRLAAYSSAGLLGLAGLYGFVVRPWHQSWGASGEELAAPMPGDNLVPDANWVVTRAVSIDAPPSKVWPWLVQMGYRRGGIYSYDWIDRRMGILDRPSADRILPEHQHLKPGDRIPIGNDEGWPVAAMEPERSLVFDIRRRRLQISWSFLLTPLPDGGTRLALRYRGVIRPRLAELPAFAFVDAGEFFMSRKMLLNIKARAEGLTH